MAALEARAGVIEAITEAVQRPRRAVPRHLRRHAAAGHARAGVRRDAGARLDRGRRAPDRAGRAAHSRCRTWAGTRWTARCRPALFARPGRRAAHVLHPLLRHLTRAHAGDVARPGPTTAGASPPRWCGAMWPACSSTRRSRRPPARGSWPISWSGGRDPLSGHRPEGRPVRARGARRPRHRHGVQRRSGRSGARLGRGRLRLAARGRPERLGRGPGGERRARWRRSSTPSRSRCSSAAASARWPTSRRWIEAGRQPGDPRHRRGARPRAGARPPRADGPSRSPSASTCARARSPCRAGWRTPASTRSTVARRFEDAGVSALIVTDIDRDGALARLQRRGVRRRSPTRSTSR